METKTCTRCHIDKLISDFCKKQKWCKSCSNEYAKQHRKDLRYREKNLQVRKGANVRYANTWGGKISAWKGNAKYRGIEWNLSADYIKSLPFVCYYTNQVLTLEQHMPNTVSLDRIDRSKGYVDGNVVLCCTIVNYMKSDYSLDEFINICKIVSNKFS